MPGWTKIPNELLDNIQRYTEAELKILLSAYRVIEGYQKTRGEPRTLAIETLRERSGLSRTSVVNARQSLEDKGCLVRTGDYRGNSPVYSLAIGTENQQEEVGEEDTPTAHEIVEAGFWDNVSFCPNNTQVQNMNGNHRNNGTGEAKETATGDEKKEYFIAVAKAFNFDYNSDGGQIGRMKKFFQGAWEKGEKGAGTKTIRYQLLSNPMPPVELAAMLLWYRRTHQGRFYLPKTLKLIREKVDTFRGLPEKERQEYIEAGRRRLKEAVKGYDAEKPASEAELDAMEVIGKFEGGKIVPL